MPQYKIVLTVNGSRIDRVRQMCQSAFGVDVSAQVKKIERQPSRPDRLNDAECMVSDAKSIVEDLRGEIEEWKDNMPDSLRNGDKYGELEECQSALEELENALDTIDFASVSFPSMM